MAMKCKIYGRNVYIVSPFGQLYEDDIVVY